MTLDYDLLGYVVASKYRKAALAELHRHPATPSEVAENADTKIPHSSRALGELADKGLVELLVSEDTKKGRIYGLTDAGEPIAAAVVEREEADE